MFIAEPGVAAPRIHSNGEAGDGLRVHSLELKRASCCTALLSVGKVNLSDDSTAKGTARLAMVVMTKIMFRVLKRVTSNSKSIKYTIH
jgi:hypothetical protein